ncbi:MAG TPA: hypothetical protein VL948_21525 [Verrucomicrobiae bacterium]|nr:hypothetical protein [Verrucomicrobiae bacterium]
MTAGPARGGKRAAPASLAVIALVMGLGLYRFSQTLADPDIWGHLAIGRLYHQTGRIRQADPFSYVTAGQEWLNFEWLFELGLFRLFAAFGPPGLIVFKVAVGLTLFGIVYRLLCRQGVPAERAGIIVLALIHFFVPFLITIRPHLVTYTFFLIVLLLLRAMDRGDAQWLYAAPALFALWANLHPGFLAGLGVLGIWTGLELVRRWVGRGLFGPPSRISMRTAIPLLLGCILATGLNPWGFRLLPFLWHTATVPRLEISEWQPLLLGTGQGLTYLLMVTAAALGWHYSRRPRSVPLLGVLAVCVLLPLNAWRHIPLATLAIAVLAGEHIGDAWAQLAGAYTRTIPAPSAVANRVLVAAATVGAVLFVAMAAPRFGCIVIDPPSALGQPVRAMGLLRTSGVSGNLAIDFDWGLYAMYHAVPPFKISMDGRRETAYGEKVYNQFLDFKFGQGDWDVLLREYDTQLALVRRGQPADNLLRLEPGWMLLYEDALAALFGRADFPGLDRIRATPPPSVPYDGAGLCMP